VRALQTHLIYELARVFGFLSASATRAIKHGTGSIFVYSGILPRSFSSRKLLRRLDFQPCVALGLCLSLPFLFLFAPLLRSFSYFRRFEAKRRGRMNKGERCASSLRREILTIVSLTSLMFIFIDRHGENLLLTK